MRSIGPPGNASCVQWVSHIQGHQPPPLRRLQVRLWPTWKCIPAVFGHAHPGTPTLPPIGTPLARLDGTRSRCPGTLTPPPPTHPRCPTPFVAGTPLARLEAPSPPRIQAHQPLCYPTPCIAGTATQFARLEIRPLPHIQARQPPCVSGTAPRPSTTATCPRRRPGACCPAWKCSAPSVSAHIQARQPLRAHDGAQVRVAPPGHASTPLCLLTSRHVNPPPQSVPRGHDTLARRQRRAHHRHHGAGGDPGTTFTGAPPAICFVRARCGLHERPLQSS